MAGTERTLTMGRISAARECPHTQTEMQMKSSYFATRHTLGDRECCVCAVPWILSSGIRSLGNRISANCISHTFEKLHWTQRALSPRQMATEATEIGHWEKVKPHCT